MGELLFVRLLFSLLGRMSTAKRLAVEAPAGRRCRFPENRCSQVKLLLKPGTAQAEETAFREKQARRPVVWKHSYRV